MVKSVLIVDDEPTARDALARVLTSRGFKVHTAGDSEEATQIMAASPADVILLDLDLPRVPGDSFAAFLCIRYPKSRIIFMSGQYEMVNAERFGEDTLYMPKPIDIDALLDVLQTDHRTSHAHPIYD